MPFVEKGELAVDDIIDPEKQQAIEEKLEAMGKTPLGEIKKALGDGFSYGEIKLVIAGRKT